MVFFTTGVIIDLAKSTYIGKPVMAERSSRQKKPVPK
jgi:hypothetical protein